MPPITVIVPLLGVRLCFQPSLRPSAAIPQKQLLGIPSSYMTFQHFDTVYHNRLTDIVIDNKNPCPFNLTEFAVVTVSHMQNM